jgi:hypothetical protein
MINKLNKYLFLSFIIASLLTSCSVSKENIVSDTSASALNEESYNVISQYTVVKEFQSQELSYEIIYQSSKSSSNPFKGCYTIESRDDMVNIWKKAFGTYKTPKIDFENNTVIAIFRGICPSLSFGVCVEKIEEKEDEVLINVCYSNPGPNCRQSWAISSPYVIIKIRKTDKWIRFSEYEIINECQY